MMIYASSSPWILCTTHSLYLSLQLPFVPLCEAQAMKTMDKAKFKAQKITSKAHSEQFILMLGDEYSGVFWLVGFDQCAIDNDKDICMCRI